MIGKIWKAIDGHKTNIGWGLSVIYSAMITYGICESNPMIWALIISWTGYGYREAMKKM